MEGVHQVHQVHQVNQEAADRPIAPIGILRVPSLPYSLMDTSTTDASYSMTFPYFRHTMVSKTMSFSLLQNCHPKVAFFRQCLNLSNQNYI